MAQICFIFVLLLVIWKWFEPYVDITEDNDVILWFNIRLIKNRFKYKRSYIVLWRN